MDKNSRSKTLKYLSGELAVGPDGNIWHGPRTLSSLGPFQHYREPNIFLSDALIQSCNWRDSTLTWIFNSFLSNSRILPDLFFQVNYAVEVFHNSFFLALFVHKIELSVAKGICINIFTKEKILSVFQNPGLFALKIITQNWTFSVVITINGRMVTIPSLLNFTWPKRLFRLLSIELFKSIPRRSNL